MYTDQIAIADIVEKAKTDPELQKRLYEIDYYEKPVDINTFLDDDRYLGKCTHREDGSSLIYPWIRRDLNILFSSDTRVEAISTGAIGIGKTFYGVWGASYLSYYTTNRRNPQLHFGKPSTKPLTLVFFSLSQTLNESGVFQTFQNTIQSSPWFQEHGILRGDKDKILYLPNLQWALGTPKCLSADTKISVLSGEELTIPEIETKIKSGTDVWVYSIDIRNNRIVPGRVIAAGLSGKDRNTVKVHLDNNDTIQCTPDHPFLLRTGVYKNAAELQAGDSLMPLYRQYDPNGYEQFWDLQGGTWRYTHRRMAGISPVDVRDASGRFKKGVTVHHKDFNKRNNTPDNLLWMLTKDHAILHRSNWKETLGKWVYSAENLARIRKMCLDRNADPDKQRQMQSAHYTIEGRAKSAERMRAYNNDPEFQKKAQVGRSLVDTSAERKAWWSTPAGIARKKALADRLSENRGECGRINHKVVSVELSDSCDVYDLTVDTYHNFALSSGVFVHNTLGYGAIGGDVIGGVLDELNAPGAPATYKASIYKAYYGLIRRIESRFMNRGSYAGCKLFMLASKDQELSFIDAHIKSRAKSRSVLISDIPIWDVKPEIYSGEKFKVAVGDRYKTSKIVIDTSVESIAKLEADGYKIIDVPIEYIESFETDIIEALHDIAGIAVDSIRKTKLIPSAMFLKNCYKEHLVHPFTCQEFQLGLMDDIKIIDYFVPSAIRQSDAPWYGHVDLAKNHCACGVVFVRPAGYIEKKAVSKTGNVVKTRLAVGETVFKLWITARPGDEIPIGKVAEFIVDLTELDIFIKQVSYDQYQSVQNMQILKQFGIKAIQKSVDRDDKPYQTLRAGIIDGRAHCYPYSILETELLDLDWDKENHKVEKPENGSKDLCDPWAGAFDEMIKGEAVDMLTELVEEMNKARDSRDDIQAEEDPHDMSFLYSDISLHNRTGVQASNVRIKNDMFVGVR